MVDLVEEFAFVHVLRCAS